MGVAVNRVTSGVISTTFISLYKAITIGGAFFLFAAIAAVAFTFFFTCMPETQGRTLEDMEVLFGHFISWRKAFKDKQQQTNDPQIQMANANTTTATSF